VARPRLLPEPMKGKKKGKEKHKLFPSFWKGKKGGENVFNFLSFQGREKGKGGGGGEKKKIRGEGRGKERKGRKKQ